MAPEIGFDGRIFRHAAQTGVERYAMEIRAALSEICRPRVFLPPGRSRFVQHAWVQCGLPLRASQAGLTTLFSPSLNVPLALPRRIRLTVTVHDLGFFDFPAMYSRAFRSYYRAMLAAAVRRADAVICISGATAASVLARAPALAGRTRVIHHGLGPRFRYERRPRRPVILCVGSLNRHKNLPVIAAAFGQICRQNPEYSLVVVGAPRQVLSSPEPALRALAALPPDRVQMRGHVSEEELLDLYNEAAVLVHAALMEGYGAVPLEAMACGCPTVLSDIPALRELCGGAALFFDPHNPAVLADAMQRVIGDPALQEQLRAAGLRQAAQHTWRRCAEQTLEVILGGEGHGAGRSAAGEAEAARGGAANSPCIRG